MSGLKVVIPFGPSMTDNLIKQLKKQLGKQKGDKDMAVVKAVNNARYVIAMDEENSIPYTSAAKVEDAFFDLKKVNRDLFDSIIEAVVDRIEMDEGVSLNYHKGEPLTPGLNVTYTIVKNVRKNGEFNLYLDGYGFITIKDTERARP